MDKERVVQEIVLCDDRTRERNMFGDLRTKFPCCQEYENALAPILYTLPCLHRRPCLPWSQAECVSKNTRDSAVVCRRLADNYRRGIATYQLFTKNVEQFDQVCIM